MAIDLSTLGAYTEENSGINIGKALLGADITNYVNLQLGHSAGIVAINVFDPSGLTFSTADCGWTPGGTASWTQVDITIADMELKTAFCPEDFRAKWLSSQLSASGHLEVVPFEQFITDEMVKVVQRQNDTLICTAIKSAVTVGNGATLQTGATPSAWGTTAGDALTQAQALVSSIPTEVLDRDDLTMYMSYASFRALTTDLVTANYFHYAPKDGAGTPQTQFQIIPGSNVKAVPFVGWSTADQVIVGPSSYIYTAMGLMDDVDVLKAWYSTDNDEVRFMAKFREGTACIAEYFATNGLT